MPRSYFGFAGRADGVIKASGHLNRSFRAGKHPDGASAVARVIGKPDSKAAEVVKAFVSLKPAYAAGEELRRERLGFARKRLGAVVAPRGIDLSPTCIRES